MVNLNTSSSARAYQRHLLREANPSPRQRRVDLWLAKLTLSATSLTLAVWVTIQLL